MMSSRLRVIHLGHKPRAHCNLRKLRGNAAGSLSFKRSFTYPWPTPLLRPSCSGLQSRRFSMIPIVLATNLPSLPLNVYRASVLNSPTPHVHLVYPQAWQR